MERNKRTTNCITGVVHVSTQARSRSRPIQRALRVELGPARPTRSELFLERRVNRVGIDPVPFSVGGVQDPVFLCCMSMNEGS